MEDYGVYNLTIGFVGVLSFFSWSLSASTQRYISVTMGQNDPDKLAKVISSAFFIHGIYAVIILLVIMLIAFFFSGTLMNLPVARLISIKYILTFVGGISFFGIISVPFVGILRASEDFLSIGIIGITESFCKLLLALLLVFLEGDKLLIYSFLMFLLSILIFILYYFRIRKMNKEFNSFFRLKDNLLVKEMLSFISWTLLGALAIMSRHQGVQVLLNLFFGVVTNAAYGVSIQINNALNILSQGFSSSMSPILMKSAGEGNHVKMLYVMRTMAKFSFFSISIFSIPVFFEMPFLLKAWLGIVPEGSILFSRLTILLVLLAILSAGMQNVFTAIGKVKIYNLYISIILILNIPISYFLFYNGFPSFSIIIVAIGLEAISLFVRLLLLKRYLNYRIQDYLFEIGQILLPTFLVFGLLLVSFFIFSFNELQHLLVSFLIAIILSPLLIYRLSLDNYQREYVNGFLKRIRLK